MIDLSKCNWLVDNCGNISKRQNGIFAREVWSFKWRSLAVLARRTGGAGGGDGGDEVGTGWGLTGLWLESSLAGKLGAHITVAALAAGVLADLSGHLLALLARDVLAVWLRELFAVGSKVLSVANNFLVADCFAHLQYKIYKISGLNWTEFSSVKYMDYWPWYWCRGPQWGRWYSTVSPPPLCRSSPQQLSLSHSLGWFSKLIKISNKYCLYIYTSWDVPLPVWAPRSLHSAQWFPVCTPSQGPEWFYPRTQSCIAADSKHRILVRCGAF